MKVNKDAMITNHLFLTSECMESALIKLKEIRKYIIKYRTNIHMEMLVDDLDDIFTELLASTNCTYEELYGEIKT